MTKKKRTTLILGLISLVFTINLVESTYAKYVSKVDTTENIDVARWDIVVNNKHINEQKNLVGTITPIYEGGDDIAENVIAPGSIGTFNIEIDSSSTDVSFDYNINVKPSSTSAVSDLRLLKYSINDGEEIIMQDNASSIIGNVLKEDENKITKIKVYVIWYDSTGENMEDKDDTLVGYESTKETKYGDIDIDLKFTQKE